MQMEKGEKGSLPKSRARRTGEKGSCLLITRNEEKRQALPKYGRKERGRAELGRAPRWTEMTTVTKKASQGSQEASKGPYAENHTEPGP